MCFTVMHPTCDLKNRMPFRFAGFPVYDPGKYTGSFPFGIRKEIKSGAGGTQAREITGGALPAVGEMKQTG